MDLELTGTTAVVTGASRGIGLATVRALAAEGVRVVGGARTVTPELAEVAAATVSADLSTADGVHTLMDTALGELGSIDILINIVGAGDADRFELGGFLDVDDEQWQALVDLNLFAAVRASRAALPSLLERHGVIINVGSINSRLPATGPVGYSEAKAALTTLSKRLSEEFGPGAYGSTPSHPASWAARCGATPRASAARSPRRTASPTSSCWPRSPSRPALRPAGSLSPRRSPH